MLAYDSLYHSPRIHESANDGRWHHICVSWRNSDGVWQFYKDGSLHIHSRGLRRGYTIRAGGSLVLGQEQDSLGGSFDSSQSFQGSLTNVNVWSYVLPASTIKSLSKSCLSGEGNVYKWSVFLHHQRKNRSCHSISLLSSQFSGMINTRPQTHCVQSFLKNGPFK